MKEMAENNINAHGISDRVKFHELDFFKDEFP